MKTLRRYQVEGRDFLLNGGKLLAFVPGLGKTITAIEACKMRGAQTVVVVCPAVALGVWRDEGRGQWPECSPVYLRDVTHGKTTMPPEPRMVITSPDLLVANRRALEILVGLGRFDVLVIDESHMAKEPTAQRTMLLYGPECAGGGLCGLADVTWLLSGTPVMNHVGELFGCIRALAPELIAERSYAGFTAKYCTTKIRAVRTRTGRAKNIEVIDGSRREMLPELAKRLRPFWHRKTIKEVLPELPPLTIVTRSLAPEDCNSTALAAVEQSPEADVLRAALTSGAPDALRGIEGQLSRLRRLLALAKADAAATWVEGVLAEGVDKVALWGIHIGALERARQLLEPCGLVMITGATPVAKRAGIVDQFQRDPACTVFIGQIMAAGTAITLTAASRAVALELAWVPAQNAQAFARHHRLGQRDAVLVEVLAVEGSIDYAVSEILARKSAEIALLEEA